MRQCMDADNLHRRLKKIIGQVQAIDRMIDEDVPCEDVLAQMNAAKSAIHKCGQIVLDGQDMTRMKEHRRSHAIGRLFQDPLKGTAPTMTIEETWGWRTAGKAQVAAAGRQPEGRAVLL